MKIAILSALSGLVAGIAIAGAGTAYGEPWWPGYEHYGASTPAESYARGIADIIRARGLAADLASRGAVNLGQARRQEIENWVQWTKAYFEVRRINREYQLERRGPRPTPEDFVRYAQMGKPQRLSPSQLDTVTGQINWPGILRLPPFDYYRQVLDALFKERAERGGLTAASYLKVREIIDGAMTQLQSLVRQLPSEDYVGARRFLESLAYEARQMVY